MKVNTSSTPVKAANSSHQPAAHNAWAYYTEIFGELYDGFDLLAAEGRAIAVVAEARGLPQSFIDNEDHEDFNRIQDEAAGLLETVVKSIVAQPRHDKIAYRDAAHAGKSRGRRRRPHAHPDRREG